MHRLGFFALLSLTAFSLTLGAQAPPDTTAILRGVEKRYNTIKTLQASFTTVFRDRGRTRTPERGTLYLSKPNRTRWDYSTPAGDLFISDGKFTYNYDKEKNSADREPFKNTEDMRIPLAFLIGQLNFTKDFDPIRTAPDGANTVIHLTPRNKKLLFKEITLLVAPDFSIRRATVTGQEGSDMEYVLEGEQRNPKLPDTLFKFTPPPGAQVVDLKQ
jgi:outer membrane lipoprotein carrier protein